MHNKYKIYSINVWPGLYYKNSKMVIFTKEITIRNNKNLFRNYGQQHWYGEGGEEAGGEG